MKFYIDGKEVEAREGMSVLDAAIEAGIFIPHLCKHPDLEAVGGCRLCSVIADGNEIPVPACKTAVKEGMQISVNDPRADKTRKMAMELILATHPEDCSGCPKFGKCELQSMYQYMGVGPERWRKKSRAVANDESNPLIQHLFTRCVRCGRCVRACREMRGVKVLDYQKTEKGIKIGIDGGVSLKEAGCKFCGACIEVCPTGSIMDAVGVIKPDRAYSDSVVPCRATCPAGADIPRYVRYVKNGEFEKAVSVIREKIPFPETLGSICTHPCEAECKRNQLGEPVSICQLKLAASVRDDETWKTYLKKHEPTGKKAAVIGAGPAGLTAAFNLALKGHEVTVFEANEKAGGQLRYGIPAYRLPDEIIDREIANIAEAGVTIKTGVQNAVPEALLSEGFDTVLVSTGTHAGTKLPLEGGNLPGVLLNSSFLKHAREGKPDEIGERVMVLGGGSVAYDCARTAIRLGAREVHIACLENTQQMTASADEIAEGCEEGVILHSAHSFQKITGTDKAEGVQIQEVGKFYFDENHKAVIELVPGTQEVIPVDTVIFSVGQHPDGTDKFGLELTHRFYIGTDADMKTSMPGVYAAGDVVTGTKTVIGAIAAGRKCAEEMDRYMGGNGDITQVLTPPEKGDPFIGHTDGFGDLERIHPKEAPAETRKCSFAAFLDPYTEEESRCEASRCLQCDLRLQITKPKLWNEY